MKWGDPVTNVNRKQQLGRATSSPQTPPSKNLSTWLDRHDLPSCNWVWWNLDHFFVGRIINGNYHTPLTVIPCRKIFNGNCRFPLTVIPCWELRVSRDTDKIIVFHKQSTSAHTSLIIIIDRTKKETECPPISHRFTDCSIWQLSSLLLSLSLLCRLQRVRYMLRVSVHSSGMSRTLSWHPD